MSEDDPASKAAIELFKNDLQHHETLSGALSALIQSTLRVSFLLNGAAIVAALTAYGAKSAEPHTGALFPKSALGIALLMWVFGLMMSAMAAAAYTAAQRCFQISAWDQVRDRANKHFSLSLPGERSDAAVYGPCYRKMATIAWWLSLAAFIAGAGTIVTFAFLV